MANHESLLIMNEAVVGDVPEASVIELFADQRAEAAVVEQERQSRDLQATEKLLGKVSFGVSGRVRFGE